VGDRINVVKYFSVLVGDRPGEGRRMLEHLSEKGVNLMAFSATPAEEGQTRLCFVTDREEMLRESATDAGVTLVGPESAFLIQGEDRVGALHSHHLTLANAGINVRGSSGITDGEGHFGFVLWVDQRDFEKAAWAFGFV
jgi:hypothetical protein